jgi:serine/threonine protein kinase/osmotically-inducible protein OsmY
MKYCALCDKTYDEDIQVCTADGATLHSDLPRQDALLGQTVKGRYRIVSKLGEGGMGTVYLADQVSIGKKVALKVLQRQFAQDREFLKRFRQEARLAAAISATHRSVATVYDFDQTDDGSLFIAMEYIEGESLNELVRRESALDVKRAVRIGIEVAEGLAAAHKAGVVHRDIKPQNIMVGADGSVRVMDFGIARLRDAGAVTRLTRAGVMMGTPEYMAPEQIDAGEITDKTDIYSFGIVLYEMIVGHVPFKGPTPAGVLSRQQREQPLPLRKLRREVPASVERIVMQALEKNPARRQDDMNAIIAALKVADSQLQSQGAPKTPVVAPATIFATPRTIFAAAATIFAGPETRTRSAPFARRTSTIVVVVAALVVVALGLTISRRSGTTVPPPNTTAQSSLPTPEQDVPAPPRVDTPAPQVAPPSASSQSGVETLPSTPQREAAPITKEPDRPQSDTNRRRSEPAKPVDTTAKRRASNTESQTRPNGLSRTTTPPARQSELARDTVARPTLPAPTSSPPSQDSDPTQAQRPPDAASQTSTPTAVAALPPAPSVPPVDVARIRSAVEQRLTSRGLLKTSPDDRWGVTVDVGSDGTVRLAGVVRDLNLQNEAVRLTREAPGVRAVTTNIAIPGIDAVLQHDLIRTRSLLEQRLRNRGLLKESPADRWGVSVDVGANGVVTLSGTLRDQGLQNDAVRVSREVPGVTDVRQNISIPSTR